MTEYLRFSFRCDVAEAAIKIESMNPLNRLKRYIGLEEIIYIPTTPI